MVCISKQRLKRALSNELSKSEKSFTDILYITLQNASNQGGLPTIRFRLSVKLLVLWNRPNPPPNTYPIPTVCDHLPIYFGTLLPAYFEKRPVSNPGPETGPAHWGLSWFLSNSLCAFVRAGSHHRFLPYHLRFIIHQWSCHSTL
jgi:hypothetical protein